MYSPGRSVVFHMPIPDLRVHFSLINTFSYFDTRTPTTEELETCDKIFITPDSTLWNPYSDHFSHNESAMMDCDGEINTYTDRNNHLVDETDLTYETLPTVSSLELAIDKVISTRMDEDELLPNPLADPKIHPNASIAFHEMRHFSERISSNTLTGKIGCSIGSVSTRDTACPLFLTSFDELEDVFTSDIHSVAANTPTGVTPDFLKKIWSVTNEQAQNVISANTQLNRQSTNTSLSRHFTTNDRMLWYRRLQSYFFTDTLFLTKLAKSLRGYTMMQLFVSDKGFIAVYAMERKSDFKDALHSFFKEVGVPISLVVDPSGEQTSKAVRRFCNQVGTTLRILEESTQWANRAELYIGFLKEAIRKDFHFLNSPLVLWDYCAEPCALIHNLTPRDLFQLGKTSPYQHQFGVQGDISALCHFAWYGWCYYREEASHLFPMGKELLGRVLGPSKNEGNEMAQNILTYAGTVVPCRTIRRLTDRELASETEREKRTKFNNHITSNWVIP